MLPFKSLEADDPFVRQVAASIQKFLPELALSKAVMVAFSGGPDSTALLLSLYALRQEFAFTLSACHVNHGLRGGESDEDERFCAALCAQLAVPFSGERLSGQSQGEAQLREARYERLSRRALLQGAHYVACGHTLDDQAEGFLFRLFRGTGPTGLAGMSWSRPLAGGLSLIRPLLSVSRSDAVNFLLVNGIEFRKDSSNADIAYSRNYIRHCLTPVIEKRFAGFGERIEQCRQLIAADEEYFAGLVAQSKELLASHPDSACPPASSASVAWPLSVFCRFDLSIRRRLLAAEFRRLGIEPSFERIAAVLALLAGSGKGALSLDSRFDLRVHDGWLSFVDKEICRQEAAWQRCPAVFLKLPGLTEAPLAEHLIEVEIFNGAAGAEVSFPPPEALEALVDLSAAEGQLIVRMRQPGDRIRPFGMDGLVKLKKYLHTHKTGQRSLPAKTTLVVADGVEVLWVPGVGLSNKIKVVGKPTHRLRLLKK